jgi:hypothetical protein
MSRKKSTALEREIRASRKAAMVLYTKINRRVLTLDKLLNGADLDERAWAMLSEFLKPIAEGYDCHYFGLLGNEVVRAIRDDIIVCHNLNEASSRDLTPERAKRDAS